MTRGQQVGSTDITSSRLPAGCSDVVAVMDWCSRDVLSGAVSIPMAGGCCLDALAPAFRGAPPEVLHREPGVQCTSPELTSRVAGAGRQSSMDGRGRALDNVVVERLWRTVKYEEV